jgi:hypothetical protein
MTENRNPAATALLDQLIDDLADRLAARMAALLNTECSPTTPWLTTDEAIEYSRLPAGTFRKLSASGKIPSHGGHTKIFFRPEVDEALLDFRGIANDQRELRRVR